MLLQIFIKNEKAKETSEKAFQLEREKLGNELKLEREKLELERQNRDKALELERQNRDKALELEREKLDLERQKIDIQQKELNIRIKQLETNQEAENKKIDQMSENFEEKLEKIEKKVENIEKKNPVKNDTENFNNLLKEERQSKVEFFIYKMLIRKKGENPNIPPIPNYPQYCTLRYSRPHIWNYRMDIQG